MAGSAIEEGAIWLRIGVLLEHLDMRHPRYREQRRDICCDVELKMTLSARREKTLITSILYFKPGSKLLAYLIRTPSDAGSNRSTDMLAPGSHLRHRLDGPIGDAADGALPSRVRGADHASFAV